MLFSLPSLKKNTIVLLVEIGSAKITLSLVNYSNDSIDYLWFTEQTASYKGVTTKEQRKKALVSTLANTLLTFNAEGLPFLNKHYKGYKVDEVQVSVSAPWSYVLLKKVELTSDDTIHLSKETLANLVSEIEYTQNTPDNTQSLVNLKEVSRSVLQVRLNDYMFDEAVDFDAETAEVDVAISLIDNRLLDSLSDLIKKILPNVVINVSSSVVVFYHAMKLYESGLNEYTFINLTMESTEIAIIRNGTISFVNFNNYGIVSLARDIEEAISIPYYSIINYIQSSTMTELLSSLTESKKKKVEQIIGAFTDETSKLFEKVDDGYLLSKTIYLHTPICTCVYLKSIIEKSVNLKSGDKHTVVDIDEKFSQYFQNYLNNQHTSIYPCSVLFTGTFFHKTRKRRINF